jgi:hypothetical protein
MKKSLLVSLVLIIFAVSCYNPFLQRREDNTPPDSHTCSFGSWTERTAATCTEAAIEARTCACGEEENRVNTTALDHDWKYAEGANVPTCTKAGSGDRHCTRCPETSIGGIYPALEHDFPLTWTIRTHATCIAKGLEEKICLRPDCDDKTDTGTQMQDIDIDPDTHEWGEWALTPPTITSLASIGETRVCSRDCIDARYMTLVEYIEAQTADPVPLPIQIDLGEMGTVNNGWTQLLAALYTAGKNVALDLSASTRSYEGAFDTGMDLFLNRLGMNRIVSIVLPNTTITSISEMAFAGYTSLMNVTIGNSVTSIGRAAFNRCTGLTSVTIGNSVTNIGDYAFYGCTGLTGITIPNSVTSIGAWAFWDCTSLTNVIIGNSVTNIGDYAFYGCTGLTSVTIPNSVTSIGIFAFRSCIGLTEITIPNSVTTIGGAAFFGCTGLTSVIIGNSVTSIGVQAFQGCTGLTEITIPNSVTSIGNAAFNGCTGLTSVTIGNSVTTIGSSAFQGCTALTEIIIPNSVTTIGDQAFMDCTGLTEIIIPNSVTTIGSSAFSRCILLTSVTFERATPSSPFGTSMFNSTHTTLRIFVPAGSATAYRAVTNLSTWRNRIHIVGCPLPNPASGVNCSCL